MGFASSRNIGGSVTTKKGLRAQSSTGAAAFSLVGTSINKETAGYQSALFHVSTGAKSGAPTTVAVDAKLQESDDGAAWTDAAATPSNPLVAITQITDQNQDRWLEIDLSPYKKFVRLAHQVAFTGGAGPAILLDSEVVLGGAPVQQTVHS